MYKVMDVIDYRSSWTFRYPDFARLGEGVMVLLDPNQITEPPPIKRKTVNIQKPSGDTFQFTAFDTEAHHSIVGIFFKGIFSDEIPIGSQLEWQDN
jgi:hypothetical protein